MTARNTIHCNSTSSAAFRSTPRFVLVVNIPFASSCCGSRLPFLIIDLLENCPEVQSNSGQFESVQYLPYPFGLGFGHGVDNSKELVENLGNAATELIENITKNANKLHVQIICTKHDVSLFRNLILMFCCVLTFDKLSTNTHTYTYSVVIPEICILGIVNRCR